MNKKRKQGCSCHPHAILHPTPQLRLLLKALPQTAVLFFDKELRYTYGEGEIFRSYGLSNESICGRTPREIFPKELAETFSNMYLATISGKKTEVRGRFRDRIYQVKSQPVPESYHSKDSPMGGFSLISDISDRCSSLQLIHRNSRNELIDPMEGEEYKSILEQVIRTVDDMILVVDRNYHIILSNLNSLQISESTSLCYRFFYDRELPCDTCIAQDVFVKGKESSYKIVETARSRMKVSCHPFHDPTGRVRYVIERVSEMKRDILENRAPSNILSPKEENRFIEQSRKFYTRTKISQTKETGTTDREESLKHLLARMERSNRELDTYSISVSHDLKSPLRAVNFYLDILFDKADQADQVELQGIVEKVKSRIEKMERYVDKILDISRDKRNDMEVERLDLSVLTTSVLENLSFIYDFSKAEFSIEEGMEGYGDPVLVAVVLENLLGNALKYSSKKERQKVTVSSVVKNGFRHITVADNGAGFDPGRSAELFQPFKRLHTSTEFPGHGVGLSTVKKIVLRHGGKVEGRPLSEGGAAFSFSLPVDKDRIC